MTNEKKIADALVRSTTTPMGCCLCERPTYSRGIFIPNVSADFGAAKGKQRVIVYPLCERHEMTAETHARIEGLIIGKLTVGEVNGLDEQEPRPPR